MKNRTPQKKSSPGKTTSAKVLAYATSQRVRSEIYQMQQEREFLAKYGHLTNAQLHTASFDLAILATKIRAYLWTRTSKSVAAN